MITKTGARAITRNITNNNNIIFYRVTVGGGTSTHARLPSVDRTSIRLYSPAYNAPIVVPRVNIEHRHHDDIIDVIFLNVRFTVSRKKKCDTKKPSSTNTHHKIFLYIGAYNPGRRHVLSRQTSEPNRDHRTGGADNLVNIINSTTITILYRRRVFCTIIIYRIRI